MQKKIILIGGGGHCKSCIDVIEQDGKYAVEGIVDVRERLHQRVLGYEVIATDDDLPRLVNEYENFLITLGQIKSPDKRIRLFKKIKELGGSFPVIISPLAYVSRHASIKDGTIVMHHALINAGARVGSNCIINSKALVEHGVVIGNHCHIATGAVINGETKVLKKTFVGSNAMTKESIVIGKEAVIGGGENVLQNIPDGRFVKGY